MKKLGYVQISRILNIWNLVTKGKIMRGPNSYCYFLSQNLTRIDDELANDIGNFNQKFFQKFQDIVISIVTKLGFSLLSSCMFWLS